MIDFKYKTRGKSNPHGKPRVYFCCHADDFEEYFEAISDEILLEQNCAIWYSDDASRYDDEEFWAGLCEMQLFVIPVTTNFLCAENNPALELEFSFAQEHHIPILPIMLETGLEDLFNAKCGNLQFLDKYNKDITAISYGEKLKTFLSSVLLDDQLIEIIRNEFGAYAFLSYRKKDRRYAQELMRLIHSSDFCRDIAIWYDEFLVPGENFDEAIKAALQKSGVFVLTVTPSLLEEVIDEKGEKVDNYIARVEYPLAKKSGKRIFPVEILPIDRDLFAQRYEGIPRCVDVRDMLEFTEMLTALVNEMELKEIDKSPKHDFLIGLAYLGGIDVEIDSERAVSLITSAAEAGLPEAMSQLVQMYRSGIGVSRSMVTALEWQKKRCEILQLEYKNNPNEKTLREYYLALWENSKICAEMGLYLEGSIYYENAAEEIEAWPEKNDILMRDLAFCFSEGGAMSYKSGIDLNAQEKYEKAAKILALLISKEKSLEISRRLGDVYCKKGMLFESNGNTKRANKEFQKAITIFEDIIEQEESVEDKRNLYYAYTNMGTLLRDIGSISDAEKSYELALERAKAVAEETNLIVDRSNLAMSYHYLGKIYEDWGCLNRANSNYKECYDLCDQIIQKENSNSAEMNLSIALSNLGRIARLEGKFIDSESYYQQAYLHCSSILEKGEKSGIHIMDKFHYCLVEKACLAEICIEKALLYKEMENLECAKEWCEKVFSLIYYSPVKYKHIDAKTKNILGSIQMDMGDLENAEKNCYSARVVFERDKKRVESQRELANAHRNLGEIKKKKGDVYFARTCFEEAIGVREAIAVKTKTISDRYELSIDLQLFASLCSGIMNFMGGGIADAEKSYMRAVKILESLTKESEEIYLKQSLVKAYASLGEFYQNIGNMDTGKNYLDKMEQLKRQISPVVNKDTSNTSAQKKTSTIGKLLRAIITRR